MAGRWRARARRGVGPGWGRAGGRSAGDPGAGRLPPLPPLPRSFPLSLSSSGSRTGSRRSPAPTGDFCAPGEAGRGLTQTCKRPPRTDAPGAVTSTTARKAPAPGKDLGSYTWVLPPWKNCICLAA